MKSRRHGEVCISGTGSILAWYYRHLDPFTHLCSKKEHILCPVMCRFDCDLFKWWAVARCHGWMTFLHMRTSYHRRRQNIFIVCLFPGAGGDGSAGVILLDRDDQGVQPDFWFVLQPKQRQRRLTPIQLPWWEAAFEGSWSSKTSASEEPVTDYLLCLQVMPWLRDTSPPLMW